jgi:hypothetical protein
MYRTQGKYFRPDEIRRIVLLLMETDLSLQEIAARMCCSRSAVAALNRKFQIRRYQGHRSHWVLESRAEARSATHDLKVCPKI